MPRAELNRWLTSVGLWKTRFYCRPLHAWALYRVRFLSDPSVLAAFDNADLTALAAMFQEKFDANRGTAWPRKMPRSSRKDTLKCIQFFHDQTLNTITTFISIESQGGLGLKLVGDLSDVIGADAFVFPPLEYSKLIPNRKLIGYWLPATPTPKMRDYL